jgi:ribosomal protein S18 acetylase RimI-like enzyme
MALGRGRFLRYPPDVTPFASLPAQPDDDDWRDAAAALEADEVVLLQRPRAIISDDFQILRRLAGVQMIAQEPLGQPDEQSVKLTAADIPEMLDLAARTAPGPFGSRTIELGTYLGLRIDGDLVAMAGERMSLPGWTEISAICTAPEYRGRGLATRIARAIAAEIERRGDRPFLHVRAGNTGAIRIYEQLGFIPRQDFVLHQVRRSPHN